jgi:hypothetical protein
MQLRLELREQKYPEPSGEEQAAQRAAQEEEAAAAALAGSDADEVASQPMEPLSSSSCPPQPREAWVKVGGQLVLAAEFAALQAEHSGSRCVASYGKPDQQLAAQCGVNAVRDRSSEYEKRAQQDAAVAAALPIGHWRRNKMSHSQRLDMYIWRKHKGHPDKLTDEKLSELLLAQLFPLPPLAAPRTWAADDFAAFMALCRVAFHEFDYEWSVSFEHMEERLRVDRTWLVEKIAVFSIQPPAARAHNLERAAQFEAKQVATAEPQRALACAFKLARAAQLKAEQDAAAEQATAEPQSECAAQDESSSARKGHAKKSRASALAADPSYRPRAGWRKSLHIGVAAQQASSPAVGHHSPAGDDSPAHTSLDASSHRQLPLAAPQPVRLVLLASCSPTSMASSASLTVSPSLLCSRGEAEAEAEAEARAQIDREAEAEAEAQAQVEADEEGGWGGFSEHDQLQQPPVILPSENEADALAGQPVAMELPSPVLTTTAAHEPATSYEAAATPSPVISPLPSAEARWRKLRADPALASPDFAQPLLPLVYAPADSELPLSLQSPPAIPLPSIMSGSGAGPAGSGSGGALTSTQLRRLQRSLKSAMPDSHDVAGRLLDADIDREHRATQRRHLTAAEAQVLSQEDRDILQQGEDAARRQGYAAIAGSGTAPPPDETKEAAKQRQAQQERFQREAANRHRQNRQHGFEDNRARTRFVQCRGVVFPVSSPVALQSESPTPHVVFKTTGRSIVLRTRAPGRPTGVPPASCIPLSQLPAIACGRPMLSIAIAASSAGRYDIAELEASAQREGKHTPKKMKAAIAAQAARETLAAALDRPLLIVPEPVEVKSPIPSQALIDRIIEINAAATSLTAAGARVRQFTDSPTSAALSAASAPPPAAVGVISPSPLPQCSIRQ